MTIDLTRLKPYGDTQGDGKVQLSFTLPVPCTPQAKEAAKRLAMVMGLDNPQVVHVKDLHGYSFFVVYGSCRHSIDFTAVQVSQTNAAVMDFAAVNAYIKEHIGRRIVVVGACTGSDAHTVGLDAIMNMKGYDGEYGLERYPMISAHNLGSQVPNEVLLENAVKLQADAILVSQVVTQKNVHIQNLTELVEMADSEDLRRRMLFVVGGPRIDQQLAAELGFDAGFGAGTLAPEVAAFLAQEIARRMGRSSYDQ